ncbi:DUF333 domain-containing protein [Gluconobacter japonicus]|uniref:putative hemolysin n=1 Tax=Gluconobacter japonicus TaxID=376620 RepID=UPI001B8C5356|nr:DUF333 domain-containing protein [Gluconobacter japonicus]MBS1051773.1 DUF333 domain-containing protein [Gluconobacter japonicus]
MHTLKNSLFGCAFLLVTACAASPNQKTPEHRIIGMPNPASASCIKQGGTLEIVNGPTGQSGMCHLPSGQTCEEWALFRDHHCQSTSQTTKP